jgi:regulator of nucleoside diphosphate kinase
MAYGELIRIDAFALSALAPMPWAVEWVPFILAAAGVGALAAAWLHGRAGGNRFMNGFGSIDTEKSFSRVVRFLHNRGMRPLLVTEADYANLSLLESPRLRRWLARATRVWSDAMPANVVTMNTRVACTDLATGERRVLSVVYPDYADAAAGRLSVLTEAGMALLGSSPPQVIEWPRPDGEPRRVRIEALVYQPEQDLRSKLIFAP